jgi:hypothetical protein
MPFTRKKRKTLEELSSEEQDPEGKRSAFFSVFALRKKSCLVNTTRQLHEQRDSDFSLLFALPFHSLCLETA